MLELREMLAFSFMQRAFLAALLLGALASLVSFFVVFNRLSFIGVGVSHATLGGIAIGLILSINPLASGIVFGIIMAWLIGIISKKGSMDEDTIIGILFSAAMALGVVLISAAKSYYQDLFSFLFGSIVAVSPQDIYILSVFLVLTVSVIGLFFKELLYFSFDEEAARASGLPTGLIYYGLLTMLAITVVISVKIVGIILASALLVIPAATGWQVSSNYRCVLVISFVTAILSGLSGLVLSYRFDLAPGATIVLVSAGCFLLAVMIKNLQRTCL
jgi:zinc transport system permease protein